MVEKKFKCPECRKVANISGMSGELKVVYCPYCGSKGRVRFPEYKSIEDPAIEVYSLRKVYGDLVAVNNISFLVKKGEIFAFLGPNGAGKTTTVEMIESIRQPTAGSQL